MQGMLKQTVLADEAAAWLEDRKRFVLGSLQVDEQASVDFETDIITESDEEDIPDGHVLAVLTFHPATT